MRARATLSFLYCPPGRSRYWLRSTKLANFSSSSLIRFSELRRPRIRANRVNISLPVNTLVHHMRMTFHLSLMRTITNDDDK